MQVFRKESVKMASCIYEGRVRHRRFMPVVNVFSYRLYLMFLDLRELPKLFEGRRFWSFGKVNLAYFRRRDHLGDPHVPLDRAVREVCDILNQEWESHRDAR